MGSLHLLCNILLSSCTLDVIHALEMLRDFQRVKIHSPAARVFSHILKISGQPTYTNKPCEWSVLTIKDNEL